MSEDVNPYQVTSPAVVLGEAPLTEIPATADFMQEIDDLVAFNSHSPFTRKQLRRVWISISILLAFLLFCVLEFGRLELLVPICLVIGMIALITSPPMIRRRARKQYAGIYQHRLPRQQTVVLSNEGLFVRTTDSESCYFWRGIERIEATATHTFFYLLTIQAIIVPARAFRSETQFRAFVDHARALWTNSREARPVER
jgi:hypothetical protein